jgi:hypothetical protein
MSDLGNKLMESMFNAWCDDECKADKGSKTRFRAERIQMYSILIHCCLGEIH